MDYGIIFNTLGSLMYLEAVFFLPALLIALHNREPDVSIFIISIVIALAAGFILKLNASGHKRLRHLVLMREGLMITTLAWVCMALVGALPLYLSGSTPTYIDSIFEIISGFTTTGATVIFDVESLGKGILFWRSFTHWIGGMGILVFTLALLPALGVGGFQLFKAESPGPVAGKIAPRIQDTAKILYKTYFVITLLLFTLLVIFGMSPFDSIIHTFGTVGTGGFSNKNASVGYFNSTAIHLTLSFFMIMCGTNFSLYYLMFKGKLKQALNDEEFRLFIFLIATATLAVGLNLFFTVYNRNPIAFRDTFFQVTSVASTSGFSTVNYDTWPTFSKLILLLLLFVGSSAGSTAGGMKVVRLLILIKVIKREITKLYHPRAILPIKLNGKAVSNETITSIVAFLGVYILIFVVSTFFVGLEDVDIVTAASSVATCLSNVGPGLGAVGPAVNFANFHPATKLLFSFLMLAGRLEIFTVIAALTPRGWERDVN